MTARSITADMTVAEVIERVPGARRLFRKRGLDPVHTCGPTIRILRMEELPGHCRLRGLDELLVELNEAYGQARDTRNCSTSNSTCKEDIR